MQIWNKLETIESSGILKNNAEGKLLEDYTDYLASVEYWLKFMNEQIHKMKCCGNCEFNDRKYINIGCNGNCVKINGKETWQDWELKTK